MPTFADKNRYIIQCQRCQVYGHSKTYCTKPYQCVKCGSQHDSKDCMKPRHNPAKCALRGEDHPANYKGCIVYRNLVATRSNPTRVNNLYQQHPDNYPNQQRHITIPPPASNTKQHTLTLLIRTFLSKTVNTHKHK